MTQASSQANGHAPEQPEPALAGTFALFPLEDGGAIMCVRLAGQADEQRHRIPPAVVAMTQQLFAGNLSPAAMYRAWLTRRKRETAWPTLTGQPAPGAGEPWDSGQTPLASTTKRRRRGSSARLPAVRAGGTSSPCRP